MSAINQNRTMSKQLCNAARDLAEARLGRRNLQLDPRESAAEEQPAQDRFLDHIQVDHVRQRFQFFGRAAAVSGWQR